MPGKVLIIDTSYLIYKSYFVHKNLRFKNKQVGAFYGFVFTLMRLVDEVLPSKIVFARDLPVPTWRHELYPGYKAGRSKPEEQMIEQIPIIIEWMEAITDNVFATPGYEADDIIYTICCQLFAHNSLEMHQPGDALRALSDPSSSPVFPFTKKLLDTHIHDEIYIYSSDQDLYQLFLIPGVHFLKSVKGKSTHDYFSKNDFEAKYNIKPSQWLDYKALVGDASDNLPGAKGIGPKTAYKILSSFGSLGAFAKNSNIQLDSTYYTFEAVDKSDPDWDLVERYGKTVRENFHNIKLSYNLSQLKLVPDLTMQEGYNLEKGRYLLEHFQFSSLIKKLNNQPGLKGLYSDALL